MARTLCKGAWNAVAHNKVQQLFILKQLLLFSNCSYFQHLVSCRILKAGDADMVL